MLSRDERRAHRRAMRERRVCHRRKLLHWLLVLRSGGRTPVVTAVAASAAPVATTDAATIWRDTRRGPRLAPLDEHHLESEREDVRLEHIEYGE